MASKLNILIKIIIIITIFSSCSKSAECVQQAGYFFKTPVLFTPVADEMKVGDTLWISFSHPTTLKDEGTNKMVDYSKADNLETSLQMRRNNENEYAVGNANDATFIEKIGTIYKSQAHPNWNDHLRYIKMVEQDGKYEFLIGIVPQKKGMQSFYIGNGISVTRKNEQKECFGASFDMRVGNLDNHLYLYTQVKPDYIPNDIERYNVYYIEVK